MGDSSTGTQIAGISALRLIVTVLLLLPMYMAVVRHVTGVKIAGLATAVGPSVFSALVVTFVGLAATWTIDAIGAHFLVRMFVVGSLTGLAALVALANTEPAIKAKIDAFRAKRNNPAPSPEVPDSRPAPNQTEAPQPVSDKQAAA